MTISLCKNNNINHPEYIIVPGSECPSNYKSNMPFTVIVMLGLLITIIILSIGVKIYIPLDGSEAKKKKEN